MKYLFSLLSVHIQILINEHKFEIIFELLHKFWIHDSKSHHEIPLDVESGIVACEKVLVGNLKILEVHPELDLNDEVVKKIGVE